MVLWLLLIVHLVFPRVWMFCVGWYNTGSAVGGVGVSFVGDGFMVMVLRRVCWSVILIFVFCVLMVGFDLVCVSDFGNVVGCLGNCLGWRQVVVLFPGMDVAELLCVLGFACFRNGGLVGLVVAAFVSLLLVCVVWCFLGCVVVVIAACVYCLFVIAVITVNSVVVLRSFYLELTFVLVC